MNPVLANTGDVKNKQLSVERAAFLILRVRRVFKRKLTQSSSNASTGSGTAIGGGSKNSGKAISATAGEHHRPSSSHVSDKSSGVTSLSTALLHRPAPLIRSRTLPAIVVPPSAQIPAEDDETCSSNAGDQQEIPDEGGGLVIPVSGSPSSIYSDPGIISGVRDKRSIVLAAVTPTKSKLPRFLKASPGGSKRGYDKTGCLINSAAHQIQLHLTPPLDGRRRHSLESNNNNDVATLLHNKNKAEALMTPTTFSATHQRSQQQQRLNLTLTVPDQIHATGKSVPGSPSHSFRRKTSSNDRKNKDSSLELLVHGLNLTKTDLKKMEKLTKINIHLHALFGAVEFGQVEKARAILEDNEVDINCYNSDGLSLLDVAVLTNNIEMVKLLIQHGAREGMEYGSKESLSLHLAQLLVEAETQLEDKGLSSHSPVARIDVDKHVALWKRRVRILRKMKSGLEQLKVPQSPNQARVEVVGEHSAHIWWLQPETDSAGISTKFKVQWSTHPDFTVAGGEMELRETDWKRRRSDELNEINVTVTDCPSNVRCYFRVAAGNLSGYGSFKTTLPSSILLSVWRVIDGRKPRFAGRLPILDDLFSKVRISRPDYASEIRQLEDGQGDSGNGKQRKNPAKINLRQFFGANVKFQKNLRRGVYFACILFHEDKVLVTTEEFPPVVEVDDTYPASVHNDFHWLMKIGCTWSDVKSLRQDMERSLSSSNAHFRIKLLQAAAQLQTALGLQDLGQLHYQPLKDSQGTMVISTTCHLTNIKAVPSSLNFKWLPLSKLQRRVVTHEESTASDLLLSSLQDQISFLQVSNKPLPRGLYLGYLKMKSSVDLIRVLVPKSAPNLLPHSKIRDNPWVSSEEWQWIKKLAKNQPQSKGWTSASDAEVDGGEHHQQLVDEADGMTSTKTNNLQPSTAQLLFQSQLQRAAHKLLASMGIEESVLQHRIYEDEVIELSPEVSVILLLPPPDSVCAVAGQSEALFHRPEFLSVPLQVFEMIHLRTYQRDLIGRYSRLSSILELDSNLAQLALREAFSTVELAEAKQRILRLQDFQVQVDATWRGSRWVMDVLSLARDRTMNGVGVPIASLTQQNMPAQLLPPTPDELNTKSFSNRGPSSISSIGHVSNEGRIIGGIASGRHRVLVKTKSDNKLLESPALNRVRARTPVCTECSVPLDLPGYVSNCGSCAGSRAHYSSQTQIAVSGDLLFKPQHSRSNETLPTPPPPGIHFNRESNAIVVNSAAAASRRNISRSENQLNSLGFQPFLDSEDHSSNSAYAAAATGQETGEQEPTAPPTKLHRGGSGNKTASSSSHPTGTRTGSSMRSNSQESECSHPSVRSSHTPSLTSLSSVDGDPDTGGSTRSSAADVESGDPSAGGIIQVYAAYESGLANGTSVKLHVTSRTVAREVVDLVVRQLNMAVVLKGKEGPVYSADEFKNFCLVAVIGARERCLRDDFRPLHLQNPWKKGRLFVRQKKDVLAAIEQSGRQHQPAAL